MELSNDVIQLVRDSEKVRELLKEIMRRGRITTNDQIIGYDSEKQEQRKKDALLSQLQSLGILSVYSEHGRNTYRFPVVTPEGKFSPEPDSQLISALSDALIYAQADSDTAQLLDHYIGERVSVNGLDGVLITEGGCLYYITRFIDQTPIVGGGVRPTENIMKSDLPIQALKAEADGLIIGDDRVRSSFYRPYEAKSLCELLETKGVAEVDSNLLQEQV